MTTDTAIGIVELALSLLRDVTKHDEPDGTAIEDTLIEIAQATDRAYKLQTGEVLEPSLIHPEEPIA
jgi:hypothetical protein